ncbi:VanZ family protein [Paenibacillus sp. LHD-117]|uniref:VanZ family protein n=1 Tax=Paenibacillus sp. LHD-117 TaxID=3071412 RepID=UPI0027DEF292|nr:VanZ family protein [Paenibacillus sp. LHD-117]MDQ6420667.1 VanZ family protein [Paenibacillus sp. LHD-117]
MRKFVYGAVVILWMALIISFSSQPASSSNELSSGISDKIVATVERLVPGAELDPRELNHAVRKNAHFFIYFVLGMLVLGTLTKIGVRGMRGMAITLLVCVLFAVSDEVHQLFVMGRGAQVKDVFIDSAGVLLGIGLYKWIERVRSNNKDRSK